MTRNLIRYTIYILITACYFPAGAAEKKPVYLDTKQPIEVRVQDLLERMTLEEKLGQINIPTAFRRDLDISIDKTKIKIPDQKIGEGELDEGKTDINYQRLAIREEGCRLFSIGKHPNYEKVGPGGGLFGYANSVLPFAPQELVKHYNEMQKAVEKETRLGIPLIQIAEGTHGFMCSYATIFPEGLALGSSWNRKLIRDIYATVAREARSVGVHALCTLVIEPNIDPRMGRNAETYSEDPYICSEYAREIVSGMQGNSISNPEKAISVLCHFPGQSQGFAGLEFNAMEMSERSFRNIFLPPWETGVKEAGALMVMATHPSFDILGGVPVHASNEILTGLLRNELHFQGAVVGEGNSVRTILWKKVAANQKQAGQIALNAGLDISISLESGFMEDMYQSVMEGSISMEKIDQAVSRVLKLKFLLGLFENPYVDAKRAEKMMHSEQAQQLALEAAREGIVLLKNEGKLLPLKKDLKSIAVIGPLADAPIDQLGDYIPRYILHEIVTPLKGIREKMSPETEVTYVKGVEVLNPEYDQIGEAVAAAKNADVALLFVGESEGCVGEKDDVATLDLLGRQRELIQAVEATGTPTVVVLINGRPLTINWTAEHIPVIIEAWFIGEQGGHAIADVLFGDYNPSGRLSITIPRHAGQLPAVYFFKPSKEQRRNPGRGRTTAYVDMPMEPLFEFGHGLSYTSYAYSNLKITPLKTYPGASIEVSCDVTNSGDVAGTETVQLYINDAISSVTTPVKLLKGFQKVRLEPGETKTVTMILTPYDLSLLDRHLERVVEPGIFEVMIGKSSDNIELRGESEILTVDFDSE